MLSESQVISLNQQADAFMLSSIGVGEAFPSVIIEAMACGVPIISSRIGATAEMITDEVEGFLLEQKDVAGLTAAIIRLANNPDERAAWEKQRDAAHVKRSTARSVSIGSSKRSRNAPRARLPWCSVRAKTTGRLRKP